MPKIIIEVDPEFIEEVELSLKDFIEDFHADLLEDKKIKVSREETPI